MNLSLLDISIILVYLLAIVVIGFVMKKQASKNIKTYFLGGNTLPWYMLGLSNASGMFDISGTMWMVTLMFVYGLKSAWIPWLWPVFNQIFLMMYLSAWLRRSNVLTGAEWIQTRFGPGKGSSMSHMIVVMFAIFSALGFLKLWIHRHWKIYRSICSLERSITLCSIRAFARAGTEFLWNCVDFNRYLICHSWRNDVHRLDGCSAICNHDCFVSDHWCDRHGKSRS